jgi:hypothetical protein
MLRNWRGQQVINKVMEKTAFAMDSVTIDCVKHAKAHVRKRTTVLQGSIQMRRTRLMRRGWLVGLWGSFAVAYAIYVEKGTRPHFPPVEAIKRAFKVTDEHAWAIARSIAKKGTKAYPYLIPAADKYYPKLKRRIKL